MAEGYGLGETIIVPAFGLGRGQEALLLALDAIEQGILPDETIIYLDGVIPRAYDFFRHNRWSELDPELPALETDKHVRIIKNRMDRERLLKSTDPCIIITTGGMMTYGPIVRYLDKFLSEKKARFLMISWQAPGTNGERLWRLEQRRAEQADETQEFQFSFWAGDDHRTVTVHAGIYRFSMSAHGSLEEFFRFILDLVYCRTRAGLGQLEFIALTHGIPETKSVAAALFMSPQYGLIFAGKRKILDERFVAPSLCKSIFHGERNTVISLAA